MKTGDLTNKACGKFLKSEAKENIESSENSEERSILKTKLNSLPILQSK